MVSNVKLYTEEGAFIPDDKRPEFERRLVQLLTAGGMCNIKKASAFEKDYGMLQYPAMPDEEGLFYNYNYFDDIETEPVGFQHNGNFQSGKIGCLRQFITVAAAYELQALYTEGTAIVLIDGKPGNEYPFVQWINYIFNENFCIKNKDPWLIYEALQKSDADKEMLDDIEWHYFSDKFNYKVSEYGALQVDCVTEGMGFVLDMLRDVCREIADESPVPEGMTPMSEIVGDLINDVKGCRENSTLPEDEQVSSLLDYLCVLYGEDIGRGVRKELKDGDPCHPLIFASCLDFPVMVVKTIAETYERDFWELWGVVKGTAESRPIVEVEDFDIPPMPTEEALGITTDDLVPYWKKDNPIAFSENTTAWFRELKECYDEIFEKYKPHPLPQQWIFEMAEKVNKSYWRVWVSEEFLEETMENIDDNRYLALWKLLEEVMKGLNMVGEPNPARYRHHIHAWESRNAIKRFLALISNKQLRGEVFGF